MITTELIKRLVTEQIVDSDLFIVQVFVKPGNKIIVYLDSDSSVTIDDCKAISRHIEKNLDRDADDFELEVSSSGLGQALMLPRQYKNRTGKEVIVKEKDGNKTKGILVEANDNGFTIEKTEDKKNKQTVSIHFNYADIKEVKEIIKI